MGERLESCGEGSVRPWRLHKPVLDKQDRHGRVLPKHLEAPGSTYTHTHIHTHTHTYIHTGKRADQSTLHQSFSQVLINPTKHKTARLRCQPSMATQMRIIPCVWPMTHRADSERESDWTEFLTRGRRRWCQR